MAEWPQSVVVDNNVTLGVQMQVQSKTLIGGNRDGIFIA
jgi:hypothetical protein